MSRKLHISIKTRLSDLFSNSEIFHEESKHYQTISNQSEYDYKLQYKPLNNRNENKSKLSKSRKRNIIWFNPSFLNKVSNNIGTYFLLLIQKHSPNDHKYHKLFNKNIVKISYSCIENIKSIINIHINEVITEKEKKTETINCNCINKLDCSLSNYWT